jgi:serine protease AprX
MVMNKKITFAFIFIFSFFLSEFNVAQQKYWVMFKDKNATPYSLSTPSAYLSAKSIQRRTNQNIAIDSTDLPVNPSYVTQIAAVPQVTVLYRSKWLNGIVVKAPSSALTTINALPFVKNSNQVNKYKIVIPEVENTKFNPDNTAQKTAATTSYGYGYWQSKMLGVDCIHWWGYKGEGMTIAVMDAGFSNVNTDNIYDSLFMQGRLKGTRDFVDGDTNVFNSSSHGSNVLSTMAALKPGIMVGTAPKANYWLFRTEDVSTETISEEYNWIRGAEFADSVGVDICTTSLGYTTFDGGTPSTFNHTYSQLDGKTAPMSKAATMGARKGMIILNAAGNEGCGSPGSCWYYIGVPADADSIITVGAVDSLSVKAGFSSFGPTSDGRIKPDLCARGAPAAICWSGSCGYGNGTSFATPILAGAVACLWQCKKFATNMQIINGLKGTASNSTTPNNNIGWGIPNMCDALSSGFLSISELNDTPLFGVFPNPFSNELTIKLSSVSGIVNVSLTDVMGRKIYSKSFENSISDLVIRDFSELEQGIYFVEISSGTMTSTKKVVKQ